jgi:hypothetical protein
VGWLPIEVRFSGLLLYLPLAGLALFLGPLLEPFRVPRLLLPAAAAILSALAVPHWASAEALWSSNVALVPRMASPHLNLGLEYAATGETTRAHNELEQAVARCEPLTQRRLCAMSQLALGNLLLPTSPHEAELHFRTATELATPELWQPSVSLARALTIQRRGAEALEVLEVQWARASHPMVARTAREVAALLRDDAATARWQVR